MQIPHLAVFRESANLPKVLRVLTGFLLLLGSVVGLAWKFRQNCISIFALFASLPSLPGTSCDAVVVVVI